MKNQVTMIVTNDEHYPFCVHRNGEVYEEYHSIVEAIECLQDLGYNLDNLRVKIVGQTVVLEEVS